MKRQTILFCVTSLALLAMLQWSSILLAQDSCQQVVNALDNVFLTPHHSYSTYAIAGRTITGETIYTSEKAFDLVDGKWVLNPKGPKESMQHAVESRKRAVLACKFIGEESVNGQPAAHYSMHSKTDAAVSETQLWIAKNTGLLMREEMDVGNGASKSHVSVRYEYGNIRPPV